MLAIDKPSKMDSLPYSIIQMRELNATTVARSLEDHDDRLGNCASSYELVMIALTFPLWTFITLYLTLLLIHSLRRRQYESIYDKCHWRNAHFRYDFHLIIGRHSANYSRHESYSILDLLDNELVSTLTIQIPGQTMFNDHQIFVYRHSRDDMRCVNFTVFRRHPIKDIKSIRIAHTCTNPDSRLYIYGLEIHDQTNNENRFFPIQTVVKYRGTQWALTTTFEPKSDVNFKKLGVECYDPFGCSNWPTYLELLTILFYIWCASYCFGHLIGIKEISNSIVLHGLTIFFIVTCSATIICIFYLRLIKNHINGNYYDSCWWHIGQVVCVSIIILVSLGFWTLALGESKRCRQESLEWLISTACCSLIATFITLFAWFIATLRRMTADQKALAETDTQLSKTNSRENIAFANDPKPGLCVSLCTRQSEPSSHSSGREGPPKNWNTLGPQNEPPPRRGGSAPAKKGKSQERARQQEKRSGSGKEQEETLDAAFGVGSKYIKARNRNSISQYV